MLDSCHPTRPRSDPHNEGVPTAQERIDPPLADIYVPDGRRTGDKVNLREAQIIVDEVRGLIQDTGIARIEGATSPS
jgi:hypothetical protein